MKCGWLWRMARLVSPRETANACGTTQQRRYSSATTRPTGFPDSRCLPTRPTGNICFRDAGYVQAGSGGTSQACYKFRGIFGKLPKKYCAAEYASTGGIHNSEAVFLA